MAEGDFAMPVGHSTQSVSTIPVCPGKKEFLQVDGTAQGYSLGLDIIVNGTNNQNAVYAMLAGKVRYKPNNTSNPTKYTATITVFSGTSKKITEIKDLFEPPPQKIIYKYISADDLRTRLINFITTKYNACTVIASCHPSMRMIGINTQSKAQTLKAYIDAASSKPDLIAQVVDSILSNTIGLDILAGDLLGYTDENPTSNHYNTSICSISSPKLLEIVIEEYSGFRLSPKFYIWRLLMNSLHAETSKRKVRCLTAVGYNATNKTFSHPLLDALDVKIGTNVRARNTVQVTNPETNQFDSVILFPVGKHSEWHQIVFNSSQKSPAEWRFNAGNKLILEARIKATSAAIGLTPTQRERNAMDDSWDEWKSSVNAFAFAFQLPAEIIVGTLNAETQALGARALALERLDSASVTKARKVLSATIVDRYIALAPQYQRTVPVDLNDHLDDEVRNLSSNTNDLTWGQLMQLVNVIDSRSSPGLMQTLLSTAKDAVLRAKEWFASIGIDIVTTFQLSALPSNGEGWFRWLLTGRNSIFAGAAYHKLNYVRRKTELDLVRVGGAYNGGSLRYAEREMRGNPQGGRDINRWGTLFYNDEYPVKTMKVYNHIHVRIENDEIWARARFSKNTL